MSDIETVAPVADDTTRVETPSAADNSPAAGVETDLDRVVVEDDDPDAEPVEGEDQDSVKAEDDTDEIEFNGEKHRIPKALKDAFLMRQDYSQKTEALAAERRQTAAERQAIIAQREQLAAVDDEVKAVYGKAHALSDQVKAYEAVNWQTLQANINVIEDPMERAQAQNELQAAYQSFQLTRDAQAAALNEVKTKEADRLTRHQQAAKEAADKAMQETGKALSDPNTGIKGWSRQRAGALVNVAAEFGVSEDDLLQNPNPRDWKILDALDTARRELKTLREAAKKQTTVQRHAAAQVTAPVQTITAKTTPPSGPSDRQDTEGWMARRNAQVAKKRA